MKLDADGYRPTIDDEGTAARRAEAAGYDGWWAVEPQLDPFLAYGVAAERTPRIELRTAIAVAFARNPMTVALHPNDIQLLSGGRLAVGLGSQIKPHIAKRYSMQWSKPAAHARVRARDASDLACLGDR